MVHFSDIIRKIGLSNKVFYLVNMGYTGINGLKGKIIKTNFIRANKENINNV